MLTTFVGFTTSVFSASYIGHELETGRLTPAYLRFYHAMYQLLMFGMNLALIANNIGLMWVAIELATLTTVLMVGIYRTHEALEAAWKYFILGSVGIALALFGTILVYMAARPVVGEGLDAMVWTVLIDARRRVRSGAAQCRLRLPAARLRHQGRPRAAARLAARRPCRGPDADLGGAVGPAAQRRALRGAALQAAARRQPGGARARAADGDDGARLADLRRLHALPAARHQTHVRLFLDRAHGHHHLRLRHGRAARQFRRPAAHDDAQPDQVGIFFAVGHIAQVKGTQKIADIRGLTESHPLLGWGLVLGVVAIAGLPPLGIFMSEFLVVSSTFAREPLLAIPLVVGLLVALRRAVPAPATASPSASRPAARRRSRRPTCRCSRISRWCFAAGIYLPPPLVAWFQHVAGLLG